jgi:deoxyribodipyrimidine photo-lyase
LKLQDNHDSRVHILNDLDLRQGDFVLYWMQQSQRAEYNHALEYAVQQANKIGQGVLVIFGLMDAYPEANLRHYTFMLEGLQEFDRVRSRLSAASKTMAQASCPKGQLPGGSDRK